MPTPPLGRRSDGPWRYRSDRWRTDPADELGAIVVALARQRQARRPAQPPLVARLREWLGIPNDDRSFQGATRAAVREARLFAIVDRLEAAIVELYAFGAWDEAAEVHGTLQRLRARCDRRLPGLARQGKRLAPGMSGQNNRDI